MRISTDKSDPGYRPDTRGITVLLDGVAIAGPYASPDIKVVTADSDEGMAIVHRAIPGTCIALRVQEGRSVPEVLFGKVEIRLPNSTACSQRDTAADTHGRVRLRNVPLGEPSVLEVGITLWGTEHVMLVPDALALANRITMTCRDGQERWR